MRAPAVFGRVPGVRRALAWLRHTPDVPTVPLVDEPVDIPPHLVDLLSRVGVSLCAASETVGRTEGELHAIASAYDLPDARFFVLPTGVFTRVTKGPVADVDFASVQGRRLRLDQTADVYEFIDTIKRDTPPPKEALAQLDAILAGPPRFRPWQVIIGRAVVAAGLSMILGNSWAGLFWCALLAAVVGVLALVDSRRQRLAVAMPVLSAVIVTIAATALSGTLVPDAPLHLIIPPLVAFLPGTALTIGAIELSSGEIIAGATRLVYGINTLVLLAFGCFMGAVVLPVDWAATTASRQGWWVAAVGVVVFGFGQYLYSSAPRRSVGWIMLALYATWSVQFVAGQLVPSSMGAAVGAFAGGFVVVPIARWIEKRKSGPPAQVTYLPAFWLLVPGALGFTGVAELLGNSQGLGLSDILQTFLAIIGIAMGIVVSSSIFVAGRQDAAKPVW